MTKYIFVTGGVVSGLGKGITAASLGRLLKELPEETLVLPGHGPETTIAEERMQNFAVFELRERQYL